MKKSFMNNIRNFVDSNVRHRIDKVAHNNNEFFSDDLLSVERHFEDIRNVCIEAEKRISTMLQSIQVSQTLGSYTQNVQAGINNISQNITQATTGSTNANLIVHNNISASSNTNNLHEKSSSTQEDSKSSTKYYTAVSPDNISHCNTPKDQQPASQETTHQLSSDIQQRHKKLPLVGFLKFLVRSCYKLKADSLLATTLTHCSQLQTQLTSLYLTYEHTIESKCLKPIQLVLEIDIPTVIKLRKLFIKSHNDLESLKIKYNGASQKQQQLQAGHSTSSSYSVSQTNAQQAHISKLEQLKKELDDAVMRFEQAKDTYEVELYAFVCRETELVDLLRLFYQLQAEYHQQVVVAIQKSLPDLNQTLAHTPRKAVFGTQLDEHLRCTGRIISPVIEICTHLLHNQGLNEEGLFRVPGSSIKIKKLKNAINAWFISLATRNELESDQQRQAGHSCVIALHDLFKRFVGFGNNQDDIQSNVSDDSTLTPKSEAQLVFDVHSIAGLLKLYLRELPEPLFTFELYDEWIDVVSSRYKTNDERVDAMRKVLQQLPKTNYENMRHLIRFLQLITCHQERNKMSSTNLAITMAPSLIWPKPPELKSGDGVDQSIAESTDDVQSQIAQMSSIGMSTSQHAMLVETLINNADRLIPEEVDFDLPGFDNLTLLANQPSKRPDRSVKSTSPTGMSTTSSSSISSNVSNSVSIKLKTHSRKGGSMDGLLTHDNPGRIDGTHLNHRTSSSNYSSPNYNPRPMSVHIQRDEFASSSLRRLNPPPVPPVPTNRCHLKSTKPMAPPVPKLTAPQTSLTDCDQKPRARSLRGTGSISLATPTVSTTTNSNNISVRPTVPPPERPQDGPSTLKASAYDNAELSSNAQTDGSGPGNKSCTRLDDGGDNKSSHSVTSSGNLKGDFEEISARDLDDIDISAPDSPVVSIDGSLSDDNDDSSFDNDTHPSLEYSWAKPKDPGARQSTSDRLKLDQLPATESNEEAKSPEYSQPPAFRVTTDKDIKPDQQSQNVVRSDEDKKPSILATSKEVECKVPTATINNNLQMESRQRPPPVKPPRSISPKISQSTPL